MHMSNAAVSAVVMAFAKARPVASWMAFKTCVSIKKHVRLKKTCQITTMYALHVMFSGLVRFDLNRTDGQTEET